MKIAEARTPPGVFASAQLRDVLPVTAPLQSRLSFHRAHIESLLASEYVLALEQIEAACPQGFAGNLQKWLRARLRRKQQFGFTDQNHAPAFRQNTRPLPASQTTTDREWSHVRALRKILIHDLHLHAIMSGLADGT